MEEFLKLFSVRDILLHVINTVILFAVILKFAYKPVRKFMNERAEGIARELKGAEEKQAQAAMALEGAEAARRHAEEEAMSARADGASKAQAASEQILREAQAQAGAILEKARADAEAIRTAAGEEMKRQALSMAVEIAEKLIGRELSQKDNNKLASEFLTKVG